MGAGVLVFNDYRGSDTTHVYPLPLPYLIYRGTFFKSDRDGVRGLFLNQERVELNLSVNATTPVLYGTASGASGPPPSVSGVDVGTCCASRPIASRDFLAASSSL